MPLWWLGFKCCLFFYYYKYKEIHLLIGNYSGECDVFIKLAEHNNLRCGEWVWLKEQILMQALQISEYVQDDGKCRALALFFYGRLLYKQRKMKSFVKNV